MMIPSEVSQKGKDGQHMPAPMWSLMWCRRTCLWNRSGLAGREEPVAAKEGHGGVDRESGVSRHKLAHIADSLRCPPETNPTLQGNCKINEKIKLKTRTSTKPSSMIHLRICFLISIGKKNQYNPTILSLIKLTAHFPTYLWNFFKRYNLKNKFNLT